MLLQIGAGEPHGLHGPPPQPTQLVTAPSETPVRVRKRPVPSDPAVRSLKNCLRDDLRASPRAAIEVKSIRPPPRRRPGTGTAGHRSGAWARTASAGR